MSNRALMHDLNARVFRIGDPEVSFSRRRRSHITYSILIEPRGRGEIVHSRKSPSAARYGGTGRSVKCCNHGGTVRIPLRSRNSRTASSAFSLRVTNSSVVAAIANGGTERFRFCSSPSKATAGRHSCSAHETNSSGAYGMRATLRRNQTYFSRPMAACPGRLGRIFSSHAL